MSVYYTKLIELLSVDIKSDIVFLRCRLSVEEDVELLWEIDKDTADHLQAATTFDGSYKYRLSFHSSWDMVKKQHISFLTRTYRDKSDRIYFPSSEEFTNALNTIKQIQQISDIQNLSFLTVHQPPKEHTKQEKVELKPKKLNGRFLWSAVAIISVTSTILLGYSGHAYLSKSDDDQTLAKAEIVNIDVASLQEQKETSPIIESAAEKNTSDEPDLPFVELDEGLSYSIPDGNVALTFDDGPSEYSLEIMEVLKEYQVGGTFFFTGINMKKHPDYVRLVNDNGFSIGSHSMNHVNVSGLSYEKQESELLQSTQLIEEITDEKVTLFRPPYGAKSDLTLDVVKKHENKMVLWDKDPEDWKDHDASRLFDYVHNTDISGSIILFHESQAVIDVLPQIIEYLHEQELQIVNLK
ncbi:polysaccharide deacetylase family protein [Virgibacillus byunsanensis]|uniref:Polysaccharide deacetylase family protein n=1 Tax=Virgibacillus byunsanensis TaxID=570945 RepID=A0ABW3LNA9_9BACI